MQNNQNTQRSFNVIPASHKPITAWGYVGYQILFSIPVIGWLIWLIKAIGAKNKNVRSYARSYLCWVVLSIIIAVVAALACVVLNFVAPELLEQVLDPLKEMLGNTQV